MTEMPAQVALDTDDLSRDLHAAMVKAHSGLDEVEPRGWCDGALAEMRVPRSLELLTPLNRLHAVNSRQWEAEDRIRRAEDGEIPAIKREIDELNSLRHKLIEQVDRIIGSAWDVSQDVPPLTESIGSALDRLSVLTLRILHTGRLVKKDAGTAKRVVILLRQRDDLVWSIAVACEDLEAGRRRMPRPERLKLYGKPGR
ncbi:DUF4254 domain-containing protein [Streptomyces sp. NPDC127098]|uniref:DUF4254 domain-containing protein n=1 Tax=Streptomyces sp. NPDC127098 TaxID=3347137 RepID=UPI003667DC28